MLLFSGEPSIFSVCYVNMFDAYGMTHTGIWWADLRERGHLEDLGIEKKSINMGLQEVRWRIWTGLIFLRIRHLVAVVTAVLNLGVT
jgi:hypothetical protein